MFLNNPCVFLSSSNFTNTSLRMAWSILAKNFRMSHLRTQQVLVLFLETLFPKYLKRSSALCVPLLTLHEYESKINFRSKYG